MAQYRTEDIPQEKILQEQKMRIKELEHMISLLEKENSLLGELADALKKENETLQGHLEEYAGLMRRMMDDVSGGENGSSCRKEDEG